MKTKKTILILAALVSAATTFAQDKVKVEIENTEGGTFTISPEIPSDGMVAKGTVFTVTAKPEKGYVFDCAFQGTKHQWGTFYNETNDNPGKIVADHNITIGAAFLPESNFKDIEVTKNVVYAKPGKKELKYDVYDPKKAKSLPIVVIVHGGGWSSNVEDIMRGMGREIAKSGRYIAVSIDYRFIGKGDGEETPVEMYQIIEDVYGAIAHIMEHAAEYGGDPTRIFITGDSAGGHLSAAAINFADYIGDGGFGRTAGVYEFKPTYLPAGKSVETVKKEMCKAFLGAVPTYPVLTDDVMKRFYSTDSLSAMHVSPICFIPQRSMRAVPQMILRGRNDDLIRDWQMAKYCDAMTKAGQDVKYIQIGGIGHAFLDWRHDDNSKKTFARFAMPQIKEMLLFFDDILQNRTDTKK